jgi:lysozyme
VDTLLRDQLIRDEGLRLDAYKDTNGFWTIGVGHLLGAWSRMNSITQAEAFALLTIDVATAESAVAAVFPEFRVCDCTHGMCDGDRTRMRALVNMAFNRGESKMRASTTITPAIRQAIKDGNWKPVSAAILASPWAAQIGKRADRLAQMLETGEDV